MGHQAQYCPPASLNQEVHSSSNTGMQDELPASTDEYTSDEDDSHASNDGGEGPRSASTDEESEDSDCYDGAEYGELDESDENGHDSTAFKF